MFATVATISLVATVVLVVGHFAIFRSRGPDAGEKTVRRWGGWQRFVHAITTLCFVVLAITGFAGALCLGRLEGWWLMAHVAASLPFAIGLSVTAVSLADPCRFARPDGEWLRRGGGHFGGGRRPAAGRFDTGQKLFFWLVLVFGFASLASMMLETTPLFSQRGLSILHAVHRYSGLGLLIAVILHTYVTMLAKPGTWRAMISGQVSTGWAKRYHGLWQSSLKAESEQDHEA